MGSEELAVNLFRITQTESKLKKDNINGEDYISFNLNLLMTYNKLGGNYV